MTQFYLMESVTMGFTVIAERIEYQRLPAERKYAVLAELKKNTLINEFLDDLDNGNPVGDFYDEDSILTEVANIRNTPEIAEDVTIAEAYSALIMTMGEKADELKTHYENVESFRSAFKNLEEVDNSE